MKLTRKSVFDVVFHIFQSSVTLDGIWVTDKRLSYILFRVMGTKYKYVDVENINKAFNSTSAPGIDMQTVGYGGLYRTCFRRLDCETGKQRNIYIYQYQSKPGSKWEIPGGDDSCWGSMSIEWLQQTIPDALCHLLRRSIDKNIALKIEPPKIAASTTPQEQQHGATMTVDNTNTPNTSTTRIVASSVDEKAAQIFPPSRKRSAGLLSKRSLDSAGAALETLLEHAGGHNDDSIQDVLTIFLKRRKIKALLGTNDQRNEQRNKEEEAYTIAGKGISTFTNRMRMASGGTRTEEVRHVYDAVLAMATAELPGSGVSLTTFAKVFGTTTSKVSSSMERSKELLAQSGDINFHKKRKLRSDRGVVRSEKDKDKSKHEEASIHLGLPNETGLSQQPATEGACLEQESDP